MSFASPGAAMSSDPPVRASLARRGGAGQGGNMGSKALGDDGIPREVAKAKGPAITEARSILVISLRRDTFT
jgi:hypothetical protein